MKLFGFGKSEKRASPENARIPVSAENFLAFFGVQSGNLPAVTIDSALTVPAVSAAVSFLSGSMANLPLHAYRSKGDDSQPLGGKLQSIINESPNPQWTSFGWRKYMWQQVFTGGRGLSYIERSGSNILAIWPMDPGNSGVKLVGGRKIYTFGNKEYQAEDVIDVPFMLKCDQVSSYSPVMMGAKAIALALAMIDYESGYFAGGGVPPLALVGPAPQTADGMKRALADVSRAIDEARKSQKPIMHLPLGHELKPIGYEPDKGQMAEALLFQIQEIARVYNLPPVFLQDLSRGTFSNTEQQDLHFVKHLVSQWAKCFEDELNLKLFGWGNRTRYVEHNLDGLMRGDLKTRMEAYGTAIQNGILEPDEAREKENRPKKGGAAAKLYIQGATVPLGSQPADTAPVQNGAGE